MSTIRHAPILGLLLIVAVQANGIIMTPVELGEARRWATAKFQGRQPPAASEPALVVLANHGAVLKNARGDRPMHIVDKDYSRGLYCHAPSKPSVARGAATNRLGSSSGPSARYVITDLDQPAAAREFSGRELLEHGVLISAPEQPSARILTYQVSPKAK